MKEKKQRFHFLRREREISKKSGFTFVNRGRSDIMKLRFDDNSPLHCDKCKDFMGIWHSVRYAIFKPKGSIYYVPCKACGYLNERTKGQLKDELDKEWENFGDCHDD